MAQRFYSEEDADAILVAASKIAQVEGISRESLVRSAQELGIPIEAVEEAERQVLLESREKSLQEEFHRIERAEFINHLVAFCIVNLFLILINFLTSRQYPWALFPILGWGMGLGFHYLAISNRNSADYVRKYARWKRQREKLEAREKSAFDAR